MYNTIWAVLLLGGSLVAATPAAPTGCGRVEHSCHAAQARTSAREFCRKYLLKTVTVSGATATATATVSSGAVTSYTTGASCPNDNSKHKREGPRSTEPACLTSFPSGTALSSACLCIAEKKPTTTVTNGPTTVTTTTTVPSTTITSFVLATPSCSTVSNKNMPNRSSSSQAPPGTLTYSAFYAGCGVTENTNPDQNPAAANYDLTVPLNVDNTCEAIQKCSFNAAQGPNEGSFDVYRDNEDNWYCLLFGNANNDPSQFNVQDAAVLESYGYSNIYGLGDSGFH